MAFDPLLPPASALKVIESIPFVYVAGCLSVRDCLSAQKDFVFKTILDYGCRRCVNDGAFSLMNEFDTALKDSMKRLGRHNINFLNLLRTEQ